MFGAFQSNAFQLNAFQIIPSAPIITGGSDEGRSVYIPSHQRHKIKLEKAKDDLYRLDNVISDIENKKALAEESAKAARERQSLKRAIQLEAAINDYLNEINRLLVVRGELVKRVRAEEEMMLIAIMSKRRLRLVQPARLILH